MKKLIVCASMFALVACGGGEAEPEAMEEDAAVEEPAAAPEGAVIPGSYDLVYADGTTGTVTIGEDGTYSGTAGEESTAGTVADVDGKACFDPEGDAPAMCWTAGEPGEDGSFTSTADDGTVVKVTPAAAQ
ncbi:hypothetical protein [Altererythrobacter sp. GH1-8]|uniref:hypothetical protein n=1 Tax=Altererythrobacter sp. GH1-8 TaxID=3349333 RepID=UPI00374D34FD